MSNRWIVRIQMAESREQVFVVDNIEEARAVVSAIRAADANELVPIGKDGAVRAGAVLSVQSAEEREG